MEILLQSLWAKNKLLIKGFFIGILVLLLQIPTFYVQDLIAERETRQKEAIAEVSSKWAGKQNISGPMLVLPYRQTENANNGAIETRHLAYFLPDVLDVQSTVYPQEKYRGIYKVMLYQSKTHFSGSFHSIDLQKLKISPQDVLWNEAYIQVHLSDVKGLNEEVRMNFNNKALVLSQ